MDGSGFTEAAQGSGITDINSQLAFGRNNRAADSDAGLMVRFYVKSVVNQLKSFGGEIDVEVPNEDGTFSVVKKRVKGAGRPIYENVEYVKIKAIGQKVEEIDAPAHRNGYKLRFARQYEAFLKGQDARQEGFPIKDWPGCSPADADNLGVHGIHTVEQLVAMPDQNLQAVGPYMALKQRAKDYLATAKDMAPMNELRAENDSMKERLAQMEAQIRALTLSKTDDAAPFVPPAPVVRAPGDVPMSEAKVAPRRGRPRKQSNETEAG